MGPSSAGIARTAVRVYRSFQFCAFGPAEDLANRFGSCYTPGRRKEASMLLCELLRDDVVKVGMKAPDKWGAIEQLVDLLVTAHGLQPDEREAIIKALFDRERSLSTGLEKGLAVPHASVEGLKEAIAALGTCREGIPFESVDGQPARMIVLVVIPKGLFNQHIGTLASIARLSGNPHLRESIVGAKTPEQILATIRNLEQQ